MCSKANDVSEDDLGEPGQLGVQAGNLALALLYVLQLPAGYLQARHCTHEVECVNFTAN